MDKADFPGDAIGYINFASFLIRTSVINTYQLKFPGSRVDDANQGAERQVGVRCCKSFAIEELDVSRLAAIEAGSVPACVAYPGFDRLRRLAQVSDERRFHRRSDEEHQRNPTECSPDYKESVSHSVVFVLQVPEKCSEKESLCQPISVANLPRMSLILRSLCRTRAFVRALASLSLALGSAKLAVPTCTAEAPTARNSSTSSTVSIPPTPITGILAAFMLSQPRRREIGLIARTYKTPSTLSA